MAQTQVLFIVLVIISLVNAKGNFAKNDIKNLATILISNT